MLDNVTLKPITGTFVNMLISDTGISNSGLEEWEQDFRMLKALGMDHLFVIRTEVEFGNEYLSAEDPRSTTWREDKCLLDMVFRLADKYGLKVFLGGPVGHTNLYLGDWKAEVELAKKYYDRVVAKYNSHPSFQGLYLSLEAMPWHFNYPDICHDILLYMGENFPEKKTFLSPILKGITGYRTADYTPDQWVDIYKRYLFEPISGLLDYCAPQDAFATPACRDGQILHNGLQEWYSKMKQMFDSCNVEFWSNVETFQRPFALHGESQGVLRQGDYRSLYAKLQEATPFVSKIITYDFFTCMSPNTEWGSARRLLARYLEMLGRPTSIIKEIYG